MRASNLILECPGKRTIMFVKENHLEPYKWGPLVREGHFGHFCKKRVPFGSFHFEEIEIYFMD